MFVTLKLKGTVTFMMDPFVGIQLFVLIAFVLSNEMRRMCGTANYVHITEYRVPWLHIFLFG